jgi:hypothetical protein
VFPTPLSLPWVIVFTGAGALVFWCKWGPDKLKAFALSRVVELLPFSPRTKAIIEVLVFTALGCLIGIGVLQPTNPTQALTAGFAWTGVFAQIKKGG